MTRPTLTHLRRYSLTYLATCYTKYPEGIEFANIDATRIAARLIKAGVKVFSPIAHGHAIAISGGLDPLDHDIWLPLNEAFLRASDALVIAKMEGWESSYGIAQELKHFLKRGKPVFYLDPGTMELDYTSRSPAVAFEPPSTAAPPFGIPAESP